MSTTGEPDIERIVAFSLPPDFMGLFFLEFSMHDLALRPDDDGEPRLLDLDLAERLGYERPRKIRELITRHMDALEEFGLCPTVGYRDGVAPGRGGAASP